MNSETKTVIKLILGIFPLFALAIRLLSILPIFHPANSRSSVILPTKGKGSTVMILLGSGGHTGEMIRILGNVDLMDFSRTWVTSSGDTTSLDKAKRYEEENNGSGSGGSVNFISLHRARKVGEPLVLSIVSTLTSFWKTFIVLASLPQFPSVLLLNGPGTSVPLAYILFGLKFLGLCSTRIVYIESLARVSLLSLSGKLLLPISDRFLVQWESLLEQYKRAEYYGILI